MDVFHKNSLSKPEPQYELLACFVRTQLVGKQGVQAYPIRRVAVKKVLCTNRAGGQVLTLVGLELGQAHAAVALHAMPGVPAQPLAKAADVAEGAVVDFAPRLVIKQLADVAEVAGHAGSTGMAAGCRQQ